MNTDSSVSIATVYGSEDQLSVPGTAKRFFSVAMNAGQPSSRIKIIAGGGGGSYPIVK
jgi:hypothetical protein